VIEYLLGEADALFGSKMFSVGALLLVVAVVLGALVAVQRSRLVLGEVSQTSIQYSSVRKRHGPGYSWRRLWRWRDVVVGVFHAQITLGVGGGLGVRPR